MTMCSSKSIIRPSEIVNTLESPLIEPANNSLEIINRTKRSFRRGLVNKLTINVNTLLVGDDEEPPKFHTNLIDYNPIIVSTDLELAAFLNYTMTLREIRIRENS